MGISVTGLSITPVKSTRLHEVDKIELGRSGVRDNRRFYIVDGRRHLINGKRLGELNAVVAEYADPRLKLTFPDGTTVEEDVRLGEEVETKFFSVTDSGRLLEGSFSQALSDYAGRPLELVEARASAIDRGSMGVASLISRASLARLAQENGGDHGIDWRRFRMLIEIDGVQAHEEDTWLGRATRIGGAVVMWGGNVGRCLTTSRDPETGDVDLPTLDMLRSYRGEVNSTEPLPFGVYGEVIDEGEIQLGDTVELL
ncbi:MAG: MOSC domain-containing protein [Solirubrobacteraceae bacterium]